MKKLGMIILVTQALLSVSYAQTQPPRELFPSDYKPQPCTEGITCRSFEDVEFTSAAFKFLLRDLQPDWLVKHNDDMIASVKPYCVKRASCMTVQGNEWWFCNDVFAQELRAACDGRYDPKSNDGVQCHTWVDTYSAGVDQHGSAEWKVAQECSKHQPPQPTGKIEWWSKPATIPADYTGSIQIFTIDSVTHIPLMSEIHIGDQIIYASDPPPGRPLSYYAFKWPRKLVRVPNAQGHTDMVAPNMTLTAPGREPLVVPFPTAVQQVKATLSPATLRTGVNHVTVTVTDASTGKPVEAQIYLGDQTVGFANQPFDLTLPAKHADLWVRSPYDAFSDVVVAPAAR